MHNAIDRNPLPNPAQLRALARPTPDVLPCKPGRHCERHTRDLGGCIAGECNPPVPAGVTPAHSTKENGDCPHWCKACAVERAARAGVPLPAATFCEGNWSHPDGDGSRIVGWRIPAADVKRMGADAYHLPREVADALGRLAAAHGVGGNDGN